MSEPSGARTGRRDAGVLRLPPRHRERIQGLLQQHLPEVEVWAYGSRVSGLSHDGSDLDLVLREPNLAPIDASALSAFLDALHDSTIPFLVEARDWARLPESFHRQIEYQYVVLRHGRRKRLGRQRVENASRGIEVEPEREIPVQIDDQDRQ